MSEFKYACPVCGQHIKCDSSQAGSQMECPTCFQKITVPQAPATDEQKFIITGTKKGERPVSMIPEPGSNFIPAAKGFPGALVVVIILIFIGAAVAFVYRGTIFKSKSNSTMVEGNATDQSNQSSAKVGAQTPPEASSNEAGDIALGKPSFAGSSEKQHPPQDGNDGNSRTRWCAASGSVPQWWEVDLGAKETITNTQIAWEHEGAYQYEIQTSPDNKAWATVVNKTKNSISSRVNSDDFSASGRYVRIVVTGLQSGSWASFYEFQAFGSGG
jgi:type II secretory pathway pseudopilin PulG/DNA-directed RNA polymerase subunit RPC12/RpoP